MTQPYSFTSHESFSHDSLDSLGYDWERIGDPSITPKRPLKVYLPEDTEELVGVLKETYQLGQRPKIRSKGHSSNDLVLIDRGVVIAMQMMNHILDVDTDARSIKLEAGAVLAEVDEQLRNKRLGLKVIGDHNHITAGGFASVGGISPSSHRYGLFLDTVIAVEFVKWDGTLIRYDRESDPAGLARVLGATGEFGVIATLTLALDAVDKWTTILRNDRFLTRDIDHFIEHSGSKIQNPGNALMERGVWLEYPLGNSVVRVGQFSVYEKWPPSLWGRVVNRITYGWLHFLGRWAGRLPEWLDRLFKILGMIGIIFSPRYASIKNIETFTDRVIDSSVADPTRMLIVLAPLDQYAALFRALRELLTLYRTKHGCFTFISFYVKGIKSDWLSNGDGKTYSELMLYLGCVPTNLTVTLLREIVSEIDRLAIDHGGFRYMHTKTSQDVAIRAKVNPHTRHITPDEVTP